MHAWVSLYASSKNIFAWRSKYSNESWDLLIFVVYICSDFFDWYNLFSFLCILSNVSPQGASVSLWSRLYPLCQVWFFLFVFLSWVSVDRMTSKLMFISHNRVCWAEQRYMQEKRCSYEKKGPLWLFKLNVLLKSSIWKYWKEFFRSHWLGHWACLLGYFLGSFSF